MNRRLTRCLQLTPGRLQFVRAVEMSTAEWIALGAFVLNAIGATIGLTWGVGRIRDQVRNELKDDIEELKTIIAEAELTMERRSGEVGHALRDKIVQVEFYVRDNYIRDKEFAAVIGTINNRFDRIQDGIERLSLKIDKNTIAPGRTIEG